MFRGTCLELFHLNETKTSEPMWSATGTGRVKSKSSEGASDEDQEASGCAAKGPLRIPYDVLKINLFNGTFKNCMADSRETMISEMDTEPLLPTTAILSRTSESIARSQQVASETEQIGTEVIADLGEQREALLRARNRLRDTDTDLGKTRRILRSMYWNVISNKLFLIVIILMEIFILVGLVYWKFFSKK
ncbi:unnamed protein product [Darwinula stevensoni]|uniref:t-SNARE coiled-coil homology domain-containing protein n=1 Tax=Darwinula stevensoni TaxID=69355 RepID=A0A7R8ZZ50_9CRUS|nr:unnamed protein product [Darwinula stevensoni]CAG0881833.1 unnamed protein product [Darwinula stevensoni]